jgi:hypothetical protein
MATIVADKRVIVDYDKLNNGDLETAPNDIRVRSVFRLHY